MIAIVSGSQYSEQKDPEVPKDLDDNKFPFHPSSGSLLNSWMISKTCDIWLREMWLSR